MYGISVYSHNNTIIKGDCRMRNAITGESSDAQDLLKNRVYKAHTPYTSGFIHMVVARSVGKVTVFVTHLQSML